MDARRLQHRMTRWLLRLFVVFSLVTSLTASAGIEWTAPISFCYISGQDISCQPSVQAAGNSACGTVAEGVAINITRIGPSASQVNCSGASWRIFAISQVGNCPAQTTGPWYQYNWATELCERQVQQCTLPTVLDTATNRCEQPKCSSPYILVNGQCKLPETYTIKLTPDKVTIEPGQAYSFTVTVTNQDGSQPSTSVPVSVKVEVDATSGGHDGIHSSSRPKGTVSPTTGANSFNVSFASTQVSGTHTITATCDLCTNNPQTAKVEVKVDGLHAITAKPWIYAFVGGESDKAHHDNHYLTDNAFKQLAVLAINYHFLYPNDPLLHLNDASLVWGGKFDILGKWTGEHYEHDRGTVIDIRANTINEKNNSTPGSSIPERLFTDFENMAGKMGADAQLHCSSTRDPAIDNCANDDNRHYHVILN